MIAKKRKKAPVARAAPTLRPELHYLWAIYCELDRTRNGPLGAGDITFSEIRSYAELCATPFSAWEVGVLRALDGAFLELRSKQEQQTRP